MCKCGAVANGDAPNEKLEAVIRSLREEIERLKDELTRLRHDRDEKPPHYL